MRRQFIPLTVLLSFSASTLGAQNIENRLDLSRYRVEAVHADWRVLCTPEGTGTFGAIADCAVEDRNGLVIFIGNSGPYTATLRGFRGNDGIFPDGFGACPFGACATYWAGILVDSIENYAELRRDGQVVQLSTSGLAEAEQDALQRAQ